MFFEIPTDFKIHCQDLEKHLAALSGISRIKKILNDTSGTLNDTFGTLNDTFVSFKITNCLFQNPDGFGNVFFGIPDGFPLTASSLSL